MHLLNTHQIDSCTIHVCHKIKNYSANFRGTRMNWNDFDLKSRSIANHFEYTIIKWLSTIRHMKRDSFFLFLLFIRWILAAHWIFGRRSTLFQWTIVLVCRVSSHSKIREIELELIVSNDQYVGTWNTEHETFRNV